MSLIRSLANAVMNTAGQKGGVAGLAVQNPGLVQAVMGLLAKDSAIGGLPGLVSNFHSAGLGDVIGSWLGRGANQPVSGAQIEQVLGGTVIRHLAGQARMTQGETSDSLAQILPALVDRLSPEGDAQAMGMGAIQSQLGGFLSGKG